MSIDVYIYCILYNKCIYIYIFKHSQEIGREDTRNQSFGQGNSLNFWLFWEYLYKTQYIYIYTHQISRCFITYTRELRGYMAQKWCLLCKNDSQKPALFEKIRRWFCAGQSIGMVSKAWGPILQVGWKKIHSLPTRWVPTGYRINHNHNPLYINGLING